MSTVVFNSIDISGVSATETKFVASSDIVNLPSKEYSWEYQPSGAAAATILKFNIRPYIYAKLDGTNNEKVYLTKFGLDISCTRAKNYNWGGKPKISGGTTSCTIDGYTASESKSFIWSTRSFNSITNSYSVAVEFSPPGVLELTRADTSKRTFITLSPQYIDYDCGRVVDDYGSITDLSIIINELLLDTYQIGYTYIANSPTPTPTTQKQFYATFYAGDNSTVIASGYVKMSGNTADRWYDTVLTGPVDGGGDGTYGLAYSGSPQQTKEGGGQSASSTYYVNYYIDNKLSAKAASSVPIKGGPGTIEYRHKMSGTHYYWSKNSSGASPSPDNIFSNGQQYSLYPYFETISTGGYLPTLPPNFPAVPRTGYRAEDGSKNNNAYYCNGVRVFPGGAVTESMVSSGNNINLYLNWVPVKYTIRFNKGNADGWYSGSNTLNSITKEYGKDIITSSSDYPKQIARLIKNGYLQYGWIVNGSKSHTTGDGCICTYSYDGDYAFSREPITDRWYNDNMSGIDVYPCWYPIKHKVIAHYFYNNTEDQTHDSYSFNIDSPHLSINLPKKLTNKKDTWEFVGWVQNTKPKGPGWEWGASGDDPRNRGVFRYLSDLGDIKYSNTYGVNSKSLTTEDWGTIGKNIHIYAIWTINSRWIYINNAWVPTTGMWVYMNNKWNEIKELDIRNDTWKEEVNN